MKTENTEECFRCGGCKKISRTRDARLFRKKYYCPKCGKVLDAERKNTFMLKI